MTALEEMFDDVFSNVSRQRREVPGIIPQSIKEKITLRRVMAAAARKQEEMDPSEFKELETFILGWKSERKDAQKVSERKDMLVKGAYKADMDWSVYEEVLSSADQTFMLDSLVLGFPKGGSGSISRVQKARLLKCISYAIKAGLNYQELTQFKFDLRSVPKKSLDEDDLRFVYPGKVVSKKDMEALRRKKKVHVGELLSLPLYEGISVPKPDLGEYIRVEKLKNIADQLVNPTKRLVLQMIYKLSPDFRLNLDELSQDQLRELCKLDIPVSKEALAYFYCVEHEDEMLGELDKAYRKWLLEDSFKKYMGETSASHFLTLSPIGEVEAKSVEDVLAGDFDALKSLVYHVKPSVLGLPNPSPYDVDVEYALRLSEELQTLGVLPAGFDYLCAVKAKGLQSGKRRITMNGETLEVKSDDPLETKEDDPPGRNPGRKRKGI